MHQSDTFYALAMIKKGIRPCRVPRTTMGAIRNDKGKGKEHVPPPHPFFAPKTSLDRRPVEPLPAPLHASLPALPAHAQLRIQHRRRVLPPILIHKIHVPSMSAEPERVFSR